MTAATPSATLVTVQLAFTDAERLVLAGFQLPERHQGELLDFARSLPQQDRAAPFPPPREYEQYPPGFGGILARMLATRNLNWMSSVRVLYAVSLGRVYWSGATVGLVGRGRKQMMPDLVTVFAAALGIPAGDLAAIGGLRHRPDRAGSGYPELTGLDPFAVSEHAVQLQCPDCLAGSSLGGVVVQRTFVRVVLLALILVFLVPSSMDVGPVWTAKLGRGVRGTFIA